MWEFFSFLLDRFSIPQYKEKFFTFYIPSFICLFIILIFIKFLINLLINRKYENTELFDYKYIKFIKNFFIMYILASKNIFYKNKFISYMQKYILKFVKLF